MRTLKELEPGQSARVTGIDGTGALKRRLVDMGVTPGVEVKVIKVAPFGDPIEISLRGYELSIRRDDAVIIKIEEAKQAVGGRA